MKFLARLDRTESMWFSSTASLPLAQNFAQTLNNCGFESYHLFGLGDICVCSEFKFTFKYNKCVSFS